MCFLSAGEAASSVPVQPAAPQTGVLLRQEEEEPPRPEDGEGLLRVQILRPGSTARLIPPCSDVSSVFICMCFKTTTDFYSLGLLNVSLINSLCLLMRGDKLSAATGSCGVFGFTSSLLLVCRCSSA